MAKKLFEEINQTRKEENNKLEALEWDEDNYNQIVAINESVTAN